MKSLIYSSHASEDTDLNVLVDILTIAKKKNEKHGITGMLIFDGKIFLHYIEGEPQKVDQLYHNIQNDSRHHSLKILGTRLHEYRLFKDWSMGYMNNSSQILKIYEKITGRMELDINTLDYRQAQLLISNLSKIV